VRPPGFEPGTRGWKPLVITPSLQARITSETIDFLNRFGGWLDSKTMIKSDIYENKAESRASNDVPVLTHKRTIMENGIRNIWIFGKNG
tara:strand:- start:621 stop:887 length:267 start_codon:yes stop_codon:yes gene_type:complete